MQLFRPFLQVVGAAAEQLEDDAGGLILIGKGIGLVGVHMHGKGEVGIYADDHVGEDERAFIALHDHKDVVVVLDVQLDGLDRSHMDVPFGHDDAVMADFVLLNDPTADTDGAVNCTMALVDFMRYFTGKALALWRIMPGMPIFRESVMEISI